MSKCRTKTDVQTIGFRFLLSLAVMLTVALLVNPRALPAQTIDQIGAERKLVARVEPEYPEALKRLYIGGVVKVEAVVTASGAVESTQLIGGSPILGQSAMKAIKQWKFSPAGSKEKLVVQMAFDPHR
ncbi:MAG TPA: energy transducer TonB [Terriglobales bacterium]|jgi:TonB family protein|nr:energy transducer TonB [Terriglobales bacterium]